jgi:hypothetical protein
MPFDESNPSVNGEESSSGPFSEYEEGIEEGEVVVDEETDA